MKEETLNGLKLKIWRPDTDNIKALILMILGVLLLLSVCVSIDYADDTITSEPIEQNLTNCTLINGVHYDNVIVNRSKNHIQKYNVVTVKPKYPTISMWAKPSCGCNYKYTWHYRTFINYCPNCHHYGTLRRNPKGVPEREYTCARCSSDFCGCCGKEKYSWSRVYLRRA